MAKIEGVYRTLELAGGLRVPWYLVPFDSHGRCTAPRTRADLVESARTGGFTHVFLFSHGWNNDFQVATQRYESFFAGFAALRSMAGLPRPAGYRPLLVGVIWPSTSLVLPWEHGPRFAGGAPASPDAQDELAADRNLSLAELAADLDDAGRARLYALADERTLDADQVRELAALLAPGMRADDEVGDAGAGASPDTVADLAEAWLAGGRASGAAGPEDEENGGEDDYGTAGAGAAGGAPQAAGLLSALDPRHALRMATVWKMKDRAGKVGANGMHELLRDLLDVRAPKVHLVGHSYGCKVVLSAVAAGALPRAVESVLLLQPAISRRAFAVDADGKGHPGGFRAALTRFVQPVITTFSGHDFPLTRVFHLAVRRKSDLGEQRIAAGAPSRFAALGGFGPSGLADGEGATAAIRNPGAPYDELARPGLRVLALDGTRSLRGHGDVARDETYWALHEQVRRAQPAP